MPIFLTETPQYDIDRLNRKLLARVGDRLFDSMTKEYDRLYSSIIANLHNSDVGGLIMSVMTPDSIETLPFILHMFAGSAGTASWMTELTYFVLVFFLGMLVGLEFPLGSQILISMGYKGGHVAAWVDAMDHIGACLGAFLVGALIMPLFGIYQTCFMIVLFKLLGIVLLFIGGRKITC